MNNPTIYYTPAQVAQQLQLNVLTIYHYIRLKQLAAIRFGRTYRIGKHDLDSFIRKNKTNEKK